MISCVIENGNGGHVEWRSDMVPSTCPFLCQYIEKSPRVTVFSEDHLIVLTDKAIFVSDLIGPQTQLVQIGYNDKLVLAAMILCALHPDGETSWDYAVFEEVIERLGLMRFIP